MKSSTSSVFRWPDFDEVDRAVRHWASELVGSRPDVLRIGYIGSYARGDWGVGSDVDLVIVMARSDRPVTERGKEFDATGLPVPADLMIYTDEEWRALGDSGSRLHRVATEEGVWVYP